MTIFFLLLSVFLRLVGLTQSFWLDEAAQIDESKVSFGALFDQPIVPHPPFFRLLMHFWIPISHAEWFLRLPSVVFGVISIYVSYKIVRFLGDKHKLLPSQVKKWSFFSLLFLSINQFHIYYSQEFRPYALTCLLGVMTTYFLLRKRWVLYTGSAILLLYNAYFAIFLLAVQWLYVFIYERKDFKKISSYLLFACVAFLPYMPFFLKQFQVLGVGMVKEVSGWSSAVSIPVLKSLPLIFIKFALGRVSFQNKLEYLVITVCIFIIYISLLITAYKKKKLLFSQLGLLCVGPSIFAFLISFFVPVIAPQRLIYSLPIGIILMGFGLTFLEKRIQYGVAILLFFVNISSVYRYYSDATFQREQWRQAVTDIENQKNLNTSIVVFVFPEPFAPWNFYQQNKIDAIGITQKIVLTDEDLIKRLYPRLIEKSTIYFFHYLTGLTDKEAKVEKYLSKNSYKEIEVKNYPGVGFISVYQK